MTLSVVIIGALGLAAGALLVWLPIRISNRGRRDLKARVGIVLLLALLSYPALLGPLCWLSSRFNYGADAVTAAYQPVIQLKAGGYCPARAWEVVRWYSELGADSSWHWMVQFQGKDRLPGPDSPPPRTRVFWGT
jgi:hypothetical protein